MSRFSRSLWRAFPPRAIFSAAILAGSTNAAFGQAFFASAVINYSAGANNTFTDSSGALGKPDADTGFGLLTPFNAAFDSSQITGIGPGGTLTLKLGNTAPSVGYTLGIHAAVGLIDNDWPNGDAGSVATPYTNPRSADVQVSFDGSDWVDLGTRTFTTPTNFYAQGVSTPGFQETPGAGAVESDWSKPFLQPLSIFDGDDWTEVLATLNGSAGGDWINPDAPQLPGINYIRFNVPADALYPMIVDAVVSVPEPGFATIAVLVCAATLSRRRRRG